MRMLCICSKSEPRGYLIIAGVSLDVAAVATAVSKPETEVSPLLVELERWGVFSRDRRARIYSRRMIRDERKSKEGRSAKKEALSRATEVIENNTENPGPSSPPTWGASPQKPETREKEDSDPNGSAVPAGPIDLKSQLWATGLRYLKANGVAEPQARSIIGKWRRDYDDMSIVNAFAAAESECAAAPIEFIAACLGRRSNGQRRNGSRVAVDPQSAGLAGVFSALAPELDRERSAAAGCDH